VISGLLRHKRSCEDTLTTILSSISQNERKELTRTLSQRLDDKCVFFLRIDKQAAYLERVKLANGPDVISIRIHIRQYPRCVREDAEEFLRSRLDD
jgi:RNA binding exosome subunit